jgi:hypothetical protein
MSPTLVSFHSPLGSERLAGAGGEARSVPRGRQSRRRRSGRAIQDFHPGTKGSPTPPYGGVGRRTGTIFLLRGVTCLRATNTATSEPTTAAIPLLWGLGTGTPKPTTRAIIALARSPRLLTVIGGSLCIMVPRVACVDRGAVRPWDPRSTIQFERRIMVRVEEVFGLVSEAVLCFRRWETGVSRHMKLWGAAMGWCRKPGWLSLLSKSRGVPKPRLLGLMACRRLGVQACGPLPGRG